MEAGMVSQMSLLGPLFTTDAMAAAFNDAARLQGMLDFEAALARAEAEVGLIPSSASAAIARACVADRFDVEQLGREAVSAGIPTIPMVKRLTALVAADD